MFSAEGLSCKKERFDNRSFLFVKTGQMVLHSQTSER